MKLSMYSIYDTVAEVFNKPFTDINDASAVRSFKEAAGEQKHKNDYVLYKLADYTDNDGVIKPLKEPKKLYTGFDVKNELPPALVEQNS